jgi:hypothetical protein
MIKNIVIVGGGSAGWMTATTLLSQLPNKKITLVESPNIATIGVGESTVAGGQSGFHGIINWLNMVNIKEDFMPHSDAIHKLSIAFENFYYKDSGVFHYPFGVPYILNHMSNMNDWYFKKIRYPKTPVSDYADCLFPGMALVNKNKSLFNEHFSSEHGRKNLEKDASNHEVQLLSQYSYQFDAVKFGTWLRDKYCKTRYAKNFTHILAEVKDIPLNEGGIKHLALDNGQKLNADLFIDCTGFRSLLLGQTFKVPFNSLEKLIPNNYAWATKIPYTNPEKQIVNYTHCTAIENGWVWEIPLWSRIGAGYVFSDKFVSSKDALKELKNALIKKGYKNVEDLEYRLIPMRCGSQSQLWVKNTCAIGLSAGFIEPLQSNGLHTTHAFLFNLLRVLGRGHISQWDKQCFTAKCHYDFNTFAALVALTYTLSHRDDTEYWREIQNRNWPNLLESKVGWNYPTVFFEKMILGEFNTIGAFHCMAAGMHWSPIDLSTLKYSSPNFDYKKAFGFHIKQLNDKKKKWNKEVENFPSPYQYLKKYVHH